MRGELQTTKNIIVHQIFTIFLLFLLWAASSLYSLFSSPSPSHLLLFPSPPALRQGLSICRLQLRSLAIFQLAIFLPQSPEYLDERHAMCHHAPFGVTFNTIKADLLWVQKTARWGDITCEQRQACSSEKPKITNSEHWCNVTLGSAISHLKAEARGLWVRDQHTLHRKCLSS